MQRDPGISQPRPEPIQEGEVRWIERLQQRAQPAPAPSMARDGAEDKSWIRRLQRRAGNHAP